MHEIENYGKVPNLVYHFLNIFLAKKLYKC